MDFSYLKIAEIPLRGNSLAYALPMDRKYFRFTKCVGKRRIIRAKIVKLRYIVVTKKRQ